MTKLVTVPKGAISTGSGLVEVTWTGGQDQSPFQVQTRNGLTGEWQDVAGVTTNSSQTNILVAPMAFYRVVGVKSALKSSDTKAPSVPAGLTATLTGGSQVSLAWNASTDPNPNPTGLKGYNVYRDGYFLNQVAAPATSMVDASLSSLTNYSYAVSAVDNNYNESAKSTPFSVSTVPPDTNAPSVSLTNPIAGSTVSGTIPVSAAASDNVGVSRVDFYRDGSALVGTATTSPYSVSDNTTNVSNGSHSYSARAYDAAGNSATSASVSVTVNNIQSMPLPMGVSLTNPIAGSTVSGTIPVSAAATNAAKVVFFCDGASVGTNSSAPYTTSWNSVSVANGSHSYSARAFDAAGNSTTSASSTVTVSNTTAGTPGQLQWVKTMLGTSSVHAWSVVADGSNNAIVGGDFTPSVDFGNGVVPISNGSTVGAFIAKYSVNGNLLWAKTFLNNSIVSVRSVAVDSRGNIVAAGYFNGSVDFGGVSLAAPDPFSAGAPDMFVAKYSPAGALLWVRQIGGTVTDAGYAVAVDTRTNPVTGLAYDNIVLVGQTWSAVDYGSGISLSGNANLAVVKLSPSGTTLWAKVWGGLNTQPSAVAVDRNGDVLVTGHFDSSTDLGGGSITGSGNSCSFVAKYSGADGSYRWSKGFGGSTIDGGFGITSDPATGNVIVTGGFKGTADFGGGNISNSGEQAFLAGYDPAGNYLWVKTYGGTGDQGNAVAIDTRGNLVLVGTKVGDWYLGGFSWLKGNGIFVISYSLSGNTAPVQRWIDVPGTSSTGMSYGYGVCMDGVGHVMAAGTFGGMVDFGGISVSGSGSGFLNLYTN